MDDIEERVREIYDAIGRHDTEALLSNLSPDVVFHIPGIGRVAGEHRGVDAIARVLAGVLAETDGTFHLEPLAVLANGQYGVSLHRWTASRAGKSIEMNNFNVYRFDSEGRLAERWEFLEDQAAHDRFWD